MWQFFAGICVGLGVVGCVAFAVAAARRRRRQRPSEHSRQLEELSRLTGEIAHEIKNPLSTVKINLQLAAEDLEDARKEELGGQADTRVARAQRKIAVTRKETERIEQILDSFLRYADRSELQLADADVNEMVSDMIDFYSPQAHSHKITMRHCLWGHPLVCRLDADMLKQAILNLFINAQQAMSEGGELMIRTAKDGREAVVQIGDTGTGMAAERLGHLFEPYKSSKAQGSGLGLPTVKRIIDRHGGSISVDSEEGKGTQFTIRLPMVVE